MITDAEIERFLREDYARIVNAVALVAGDHASAEDLVQEAVARAWYASGRGDAIVSLPSWVATVALNLARSRWRRSFAERRARLRLGRGPSAVTSAAATEDQVDVMRALAELPRRQREVAVLRYLLDMDTKEAASVLGVSEGTVKNSLAKARAGLAARLRIADAEEANDVPDR